LSHEELVSARVAVDRAVAEMRDHCPDFNPHQPVPTIISTQFAELAASGDRLIVVWWLGKQSSGVFFISKEGVEFEPLSQAPELNSLLSRYREELGGTSFSLTRHIGSTEVATGGLIPHAISQVLIVPIEARLKRMNANRITIVPHHYLHLIPFHALEENGRPMISRYAVDYSPSLSLLRICQQRNAAPNQLQLASSLIVGNPDGSLQVADIEADQISRMRISPLLFKGRDATARTVLSNTGRCNVLHFACHGRSGEKQEEDFALVLAPSLNHTGLLTAGQIASQISLPRGSAVFLSACSSGQTVLGETDEYIGLVGAFLLAGATVIVASLWFF